MNNVLKAKQYVKEISNKGKLVVLDIRGEDDIELVRVSDGYGVYNIPEFVSSVGFGAFSGTHYNEINILGSIKSYEGVFSGIESDRLVVRDRNSKVRNFSNMFSECEKVKHIDIMDINIDNCDNMHKMFSGCKGLEDIVGLRSSNKLKDISKMFMGCKNLIEIDVKDIDIDNVIDISNFVANSGIIDLDLGNKRLQKCCNVKNLASGCKRLISVVLPSMEIGLGDIYGTEWSMLYGNDKLKLLDMTNVDVTCKREIDMSVFAKYIGSDDDNRLVMINTKGFKR